MSNEEIEKVELTDAVEDETDELTDDQKKEVKIPDPDKTFPSDFRKHLTIAQFKAWRKNLMANLNGVLQTFQLDLVNGQVRVNLAWNGMNAVIRALMNKGLITENDIREAGVELMTEARANIDKAKVAAETKSPPINLTKVPLEVIRDHLNAAAKAQRDS